MLEVTLSGVNGRQWLLTGSESTSEVLAPMEALAGLVGTSSRSDLSVPGRSGVLPGRPRYGAIETQVEFYLHANDGEEMERVYREFRQAWNLWDVPVTPPPTRVKINADHPLGPFWLDLWLSQPLAGVPVDMRRRTSATVVVDVLNPTGLARSNPITETGTVEVINSGDSVIYPRIEYSGSGGEVISPSGAAFRLPAVDDFMVVDLDPRRLRLDGAFPEGVEPKQSGTWTVPEGATLSWEVLVADPWA